MPKMLRVPINPQMIRWARQRAGLDIAHLQKAFPKIREWESGKLQPTIRQLERFARATHIPFGILFLDIPPDEPLPIPDFRIATGAALRPSPDLLDTIYACQQRQEWYRGYLQTIGEDPLPFVSTASLSDDPASVAADIRHHLRFDLDERHRISTWTGALRQFVDQAESVGILVMSSSVVSNNTHRKLNPDEFRGFALIDDMAPLVFVNAADTKSAQTFTLAHELAHIWLGRSGVSDVGVAVFPTSGVERWCNQVAAELLAPTEVLRQLYRPDQDLHQEMDRLARHFKVSTLVILRRIYDIGGLEQDEFWQTYREELARLRQFERRGEGGGDFYRTLNTRVSKSFARAVISSTLEGQTLFRDAFQMLGIRKQETFDKFAQAWGMM